MSNLSILFVNANSSYEVYQELSKDHSAIEPNIWAGLLAQHCRKNHSVAILDCEADRLGKEEAALIIKYMNPRIACFVVYGAQPSASAQCMEGAISLVKEVKKLAPHIKTLFIGGYVSALPLDTLKEDAIDFVACNEGVYTTSDLLMVDDLEDHNVLLMVKGLGWKQDGHLTLNPPSSIVPQERLEYDLPGVAWDLMPPLSKFRTAGWHSWPNGSVKSPFASLYTSLGCPFKCFPAGVKVITAIGTNQPVQRVKVGDALIGYNEKTGERAETKVIRCIKNEEKEYLIRIKFNNGKTIKCTEEHPFYVRKQWTKAIDLQIGDEVSSLKNDCIKVKEVKRYNLKNPIAVYNFECYPHSNYFVNLSRSDDYILSHNCSFCMINIINRTDNSPNVASDKSAIFRYWRPEFMIKEFEFLAEQGVTNIKIADEMFILREAHFMRLCELIIERKLNLNIWCYGRCDTTRKHYLDTLKNAGVNFIGLGIESPNQVVRKNVIKGNFQEIKIKDVIKDIRNAGISVGGNYITGLPEDTLETMKETLDFAIDMNTENCNIYSAMAYPGSPLYLIAKENGWQLPDRYAGYSQHSFWTQNLPSNYLSAAEILRFRDEAWFKYFTNPSYLDMLEKKFGKPARDDVDASTKIKLKRRLLGDELD